MHIQSSVNERPIADAGREFTTYVNVLNNFDASNSYDNDGNIVSYLWNFGDGVTSDQVSIDHVYTEPGYYDVTLTVTDNKGAVATDSIKIEVKLEESTVNATSMVAYKTSNLDRSTETFFRTDNIYFTFKLINEHYEATGDSVNNIQVNILTENGNIMALTPFTGYIGLFVVYVENGRICIGLHGFCMPTGTTYYYKGYITEDDSNLGSADIKVKLNNVIINGIKNIEILNNIPNVNGTITGEIARGNILVFSAEGSNDVEDGTDLVYRWNFGDGNTALGLISSHSYNVSGNYIAGLTVIDSEGDSSFKLFSLTIPPGPIIPPERNGIPAVMITNPSNNEFVNKDSNINFRSEISDLEDNVEGMKCTLSFGDGFEIIDDCDNLLNVNHVYQNVGVYTAILIAVDSDNNFGSDSVVVHVIGIVPRDFTAVMDISNTNPYINQVVDFSAERSSGDIVSYLWNFGDGNTASGLRISHSYNRLGLYNVKLTVTGRDGTKKIVSGDVNVFGFGLDSQDRDHASTKFTSESDYHNFQVGRILTSSNNIRAGDTINVYMKVSNFGDITESLNINFYVPGIGTVAVVSTRLSSGEISVLPLVVRIPSYVKAGDYIAVINVDNREGVYSRGYWAFSVEN